MKLKGMTNRIMSVIMTLVLVAGEINLPAFNLPVYASETEEVQEEISVSADTAERTEAEDVLTEDEVDKAAEEAEIVADEAETEEETEIAVEKETPNEELVVEESKGAQATVLFDDSFMSEGFGSVYYGHYGDAAVLFLDNEVFDNGWFRGTEIDEDGNKKKDTNIWAGIYCDGDLILALRGSNTLKMGVGSSNASERARAYGIYVKGTLTIVGPKTEGSSLTITSVDSKNQSVGIYAGSFKMINTDTSYGTVENGGSKTVSLSSYNSSRVTVNANGGSTKNSGSLEQGYPTKYYSAGVFTSGDMEIQTGTVNAQGGDSSRSHNFGIYCGGKAAIKGGTVKGTAKGTYASHENCGIRVKNSLAVTGGAITGTAGDNKDTNGKSYGLKAASLTMSAGSITGKSGRVGNFIDNGIIAPSPVTSAGMFIEGAASVTGGTITGTSGICGDGWSHGLHFHSTLSIPSGSPVITGTGAPIDTGGYLAGESSSSAGVYIADALTAKGGTISGKGSYVLQTGHKYNYSYGVYAGKYEATNTLSGVKITGTTENNSETICYPGRSEGIRFEGNTTVTKGIIEGYGGMGGISRGIYSGRTLTVNGGSVSGTAYLNELTQCSMTGSYGIESAGISATGGRIEGKGGSVSLYGISYGIAAGTGGITLSGSAVLTATTTDKSKDKNGGAQGVSCPKAKIEVGGTASLTAEPEDGCEARRGIVAGQIICSGKAVINATAGKTTFGSDKSYGIQINGTVGEETGLASSVNGGTIIATGYDKAVYIKGGSITAPVIEGSTNMSGTGLTHADSISDSWKYASLDATKVIVTMQGWTYGDTKKTPSYTKYTGYTPTIKYTGRNSTNYSSSTTCPTDAGDYTVNVTYSSACGGQSGSADFTIAAKSLSKASIVHNGTLTYSGYSQTESITVKVDGQTLYKGTDYTVKNSSDTTTDVAVKTISIAGIGNYSGTKTDSASWGMQKKTPATADFNIPSISARKYTGSAAAALTAPTLKSPRTNCGNVTVKYAGSLTPPKDAGTYTVTFDVAGGSNYNAKTGLPYGTLTINKIDYTGVKSVNDNVPSGRTTTDKTLLLPELPEGAAYQPPSFTTGFITAASVTGGNTLTYSTSAQEADTSATITVPVKNAKNYNDYNVIVTVTADARETTAVFVKNGTQTITDISKTYGDTVFTLSAEAVKPGTSGQTSWTVDDSDVATVNAGGTVTIKGAGTTVIHARYSSDTTVGETDVTLNVAAKSVSITGVKAKDKEYNGNTDAVSDISAAVINGVLDADKSGVSIVSGTGTFDTRDTGKNKTVTFSEFELIGSRADNYSLSAQPDAAKAEITAKGISAAVTAAGRDYQKGNKIVILTGGSLTGTVDGDDVDIDLSEAKGVMDSDNAGTNDVTVTGVKLTGKDAGNYVLTKQPEGVTVTIGKIEWTDTAINAGGTVGKSAAVDISAYIAEGATVGMVQADNTSLFDIQPTVTEGKLSFKFKSSTEIGTAADVTVKVNNATNYENYDLVVTLTAEHVHDTAGTHVAAKAASCEEDGHPEYWQCQICGKYYANDQGTMELLSVEIPALGHQWGEWKTVKEATETETGLKRRSCGRVGCGKTEEEELPLVIPADLSVREVSISINSITIKMGEEYQLTAVVTPENAKDKSVSWTTSDKTVAVVDANGLVKGVKNGSAKIIVTTTDGEKTAECAVTVTDESIGDDDKTTRISKEDLETYVVPVETVSEPDKPEEVKMSSGVTVSVVVSTNYVSAVTYTGKKIKPEDAIAANGLGAWVDTSDIVAKAGLQGKNIEGLFKISYKCKKNTDAGVDTASFYAVIKLDKNVLKSLNLRKQEKADLNKMVKAANKMMKAKPCRFTINKASLADMEKVEVKAKLNKDGSLKLKNEQLSGVKSVSVTFKEGTKKKLTKKMYGLGDTNVESKKVKVTGKKNYTGSVTVGVE